MCILLYTVIFCQSPFEREQTAGTRANQFILSKNVNVLYEM